jgi:hypothetical protein
VQALYGHGGGYELDQHEPTIEREETKIQQKPRYRAWLIYACSLLMKN